MGSFAVAIKRKNITSSDAAVHLMNDLRLKMGTATKHWVDFAVKLTLTHDYFVTHRSREEFFRELKARLGLSRRSYYNYRSCMERFGKMEATLLQHAQFSALVLLSQTACPVDIVDWAIKCMKQGELVTKAEVMRRLGYVKHETATGTGSTFQVTPVGGRPPVKVTTSHPMSLKQFLRVVASPLSLVEKL